MCAACPLQIDWLGVGHPACFVPNGCLIEAPWLVHGGHGASITSRCGSPPRHHCWQVGRVGGGAGMLQLRVPSPRVIAVTIGKELRLG
jgi:hypothetical protein